VGESSGGLLVVGWGSTYGAITSAVRRVREEGHRVSHLHLRHLSPLPGNLGEVLARYDRILVPELNLGQLALLLQGRFVRPVERLNKVQGVPFSATEIEERILELTEAGGR
jgi:2-oxoglutarate ferredoxin oxidoreductase subunit alpha